MSSTWCSALLLAALLSALPPLPGSAQGTTRVEIRGTILDARSGLPLGKVEVRLAELGLVLMTDSAGTFVVPDLAPGTYLLSLQRAGYEPIEGPLQVLRTGGMVIRLNLISAPTEAADSRIHGIVKDVDSGSPLAGARVIVEGVPGSYATDQDGRFAIPDVLPGTRRITVSRSGYSARTDSVDVPPGSFLSLVVELAGEPIPLAPILVSVEPRNLDLELAGFYDRRDREHGVFLTRAAIEERNPVTSVDLLEGIPGVRIIREGINRMVVLAGRRAMSLMQDPHAEPCYPTVWMNGMLVQQASYDRPVNLDDLVGPWEIEGLEVYQSTSRIPIQFNVQGACGVLVVWTRSGGGGRLDAPSA